jgi:phage terminase small subunit
VKKNERKSEEMDERKWKKKNERNKIGKKSEKIPNGVNLKAENCWEKRGVFREDGRNLSSIPNDRLEMIGLRVRSGDWKRWDSV